MLTRANPVGMGHIVAMDFSPLEVGMEHIIAMDFSQLAVGMGHIVAMDFSPFAVGMGHIVTIGLSPDPSTISPQRQENNCPEIVSCLAMTVLIGYSYP